MGTLKYVNREEIKIANLVDSPFQTRKDIDQKTITDLANSIKETGLIQPIAVREVGKKYELLAGKRRWLAVASLERAIIEAIIYECDDETAAATVIVENLQREDVHAMDQAVAYNNLMKKGKMTIPEIAIKVGKSEQYVTRVINLTHLVEKAVIAFRKKIIDLDNAYMLSLFETKYQNDYIKDGIRNGNQHNGVQNWMQNHVMKNLDQAPFPLDQPVNDVVACKECPLNTANQGILFKGVLKEHLCTSLKCYEGKQNAFYKEAFKKLQEDNKGTEVMLVSADYSSPDTMMGKRVINKYEIPNKQQLVTKKEEGATPVLIIGNTEHRVAYLVKRKQEKGISIGSKEIPENETPFQEYHRKRLKRWERHNAEDYRTLQEQIVQMVSELKNHPLPVFLMKFIAEAVLYQNRDTYCGVALVYGIKRARDIRHGNDGYNSNVEKELLKTVTDQASFMRLISAVYAERKAEYFNNLKALPPKLVEYSKLVKIPTDKMWKKIQEERDTKRAEEMAVEKSLKEKEDAARKLHYKALTNPNSVDERYRDVTFIINPEKGKQKYCELKIATTDIPTLIVAARVIGLKIPKETKLADVKKLITERYNDLLVQFKFKKAAGKAE